MHHPVAERRRGHQLLFRLVDRKVIVGTVAIRPRKQFIAEGADFVFQLDPKAEPGSPLAFAAM